MLAGVSLFAHYLPSFETTCFTFVEFRDLFFFLFKFYICVTWLCIQVFISLVFEICVLNMRPVHQEHKIRFFRVLKSLNELIGQSLKVLELIYFISENVGSLSFRELSIESP